MKNHQMPSEKSHKKYLALQNRAGGLATALLLFVLVLYIATLAKLAMQS